MAYTDIDDPSAYFHTQFYIQVQEQLKRLTNDG
jgi:hypothetical protein